MEPEKETSSRARSSPSLLALLGILFSSFLILRFLSKWQIKQGKQPNSPQQDTTDQRAKVPVIISEGESNTVASPNTESETDKSTPTNRWWEKVSAIAQAAIACVTLGLLFATYAQVTLYRQQLEGTQGALVLLNGNPTVFPYPVTESSENISIGMKNERPVPANKAKICAQIRLIRVSDGTPTGKTWPCNIDIGAIPQATPDNTHNIYKQCFIQGIGPDELAAISNRTETLALDGFYSYDNGFGTIQKQTLCYRYVHPAPGDMGEDQTAECDIFPLTMKNLLKYLAKSTK